MNLNPNMSARDYLLESSKGTKFELIDLPFTDGMGPFGDERHNGVERLPELPENETEDYEPQDEELQKLIASIKGTRPQSGRVILEFIERDNEFRRDEIFYDWSVVVLLATPRDPKGPFTISVYQDHVLCGWLVGNDADIVACDLVENYDYGAALVPAYRLAPHEDKTYFAYDYNHEEMLYI